MRVANWETGSAMPSLLSKVETLFPNRGKAQLLRQRRFELRYARPRAPTSRAELGGEIVEIRRRDVDRRLGSGFADARPVFVRPRDVGRTQSALRCVQKIVVCAATIMQSPGGRSKASQAPR